MCVFLSAERLTTAVVKSCIKQFDRPPSTKSSLRLKVFMDTVLINERYMRTGPVNDAHV